MELKYSKNDYRKCKICGKEYILVCSHVWQAHRLKNSREYKEQFGLDVSKSIIGKTLKNFKREKNLEYKSTENIINSGKKTRYRKEDKRAGNYKRSLQTIKKLKELIKFIKHYGNHKIIICSFCGKKYKKFYSELYGKKRESKIGNKWNRYCGWNCFIKSKKKYEYSRI